LSVETSNQPIASLPSPTMLAAVVDQPVDPVGVGALQRDLADVDLRACRRAEDEGLDPGPAAVGRQRRAGVAVGRHRDAGDAELLGHRDRHDQAARLERAGRQAPLVLDDEAVPPPRRAPCRAARSAASVSPSDTMFSARDRQELAVAPQVRRPCRELVRSTAAATAVEVVADQQRLARSGQVVQLSAA
jgi:hypothetical protein